VLIWFYAPLEADQGVIQKIFYVHVPLAIVALLGFVGGGLLAIPQLRSGSREWDMRSYVAIHLSLVFAVGALLTGSIWARASWGHWWEWNEPVLVSFLIVFLLYCCYQPLRFSIEDPERQARYASVFAIAAGAFVPINFIAVRLATAQVHPRVLFATLWKLELTSKNASAELRRLRRRLEGDGEEESVAADDARVAQPVAVP
jgi:heme exporter protein C